MNNNIQMALCNEGSETYKLTKGKYYIVQEDNNSTLDGIDYMFVVNDSKVAVNVRSNRFGGIITISPKQFSNINKIGIVI